jgi:hypothetical protein
MKKIVLSSLVILISVSSVWSQKMYLSIKSGYSLGIEPRYVMEQNINYASTIVYSGSINNESLSLGNGINSTIAYGYFFTNHLGMELGLSYLSGSSNTINQRTSMPIGDFPNLTVASTDIYKSTSFCFSPSLIIATDRTKKYSLYSRTGVLIATSTMVNEQTITKSFIGYTSTEEKNIALTGDVRLGFTTSVGVAYQLSGKLTAFGELEMKSLSFVPSKGKTTRYTMDGEDKLSELSTSQREYKFYDGISNYSSGTDDSQSTYRLKSKYPLSSIGFNIGLRLSL